MTRVVLISGGTQGLGAALSLEFSAAGFQVIATYRSNHDAARRFLEIAQARTLPTGCITCLQHDATTDLPALPMLETASELVLIHNACAPFEPKPMHLYEKEELRQQWEVAVLGGWNLAQSLIRPMIKTKKGTIINILSEVVEGPTPKGFSAYICAKYGLLGLTQALAAEYSGRGIRVFGISPGFMDTSLTSGWDLTLKKALSSTPGKITSTPESVARFTRVLYERSSTAVPGRGENYVDLI
jgi:3-oxoacyl-[acyl-carrier protein] reductase